QQQIKQQIAQSLQQDAPLQRLQAQLAAAQGQLQGLKAQFASGEKQLKNLLLQERQLRQRQEQLRQDQEANKLNAQTLHTQLQGLQAEAFDINAALAMLPAHADSEQLQQQLADDKNALEALGPVNLAALEEYEQACARAAYLNEQQTDLHQALECLENAIKQIDRESRQRFKHTFDGANEGLQTLFPQVFAGGSAYLELTGDDLLAAGVAIMARPPGKKNSTIHLLSGGEKALTALALVFALFRLNPAPFCLLDEVDAPLDDANVGRFARLVEAMAEQVQFIFITHNKIAMEMAEHLLGVTMQEPGVSRVVSVDIAHAAELAAD
ncbi:MAG TPA: AAA family ATPase, partial [Cellvibrionaceae bacterium]|nr:AAA family ATPase [Cellvibrionaceae bacterium]